MSLHALYDFVAGRHDNTFQQGHHDDSSEYESQIQWKRTFEEDNEGILGIMRERIREAKRESRLVQGLSIKVNHVNYISPPLPSRLPTVRTTIHRALFFIPRFIKQRILYPNASRKTILSDINFKIKEKTMTLLLGSPGSGKSSLCRILAQQNLSGKITGDIIFGNEPIHHSDHHHRVAFVSDENIHLAHLTVKQTFEFADALLNPPYDKEKQNKKINAILEILGLTHRADTIVGNDLVRGVSGGERRRVSIGVELMKRFQLMVLDEPTTGLDSTTSLQIFQALRIIADEISPVFATLKQPGRELFNLFDQVIIMHQGHICYAGPRDEMIDYFVNLGYDLDRSINPADEILSLLDESGDEIIKNKNNLLSASSLHQLDDDEIVNSSTDENSNSQEENNEFKTIPLVNDDHMDDDDEDMGNQVRYKKYNRNWIVQFFWVIKRSLQEFKNNPGVAMGRIIFAIIVSLIVGTLFLQLPNNQVSINSINGALFIVATFSAFQALSGLPTTFAVRDVFYYQRRNCYYHPIPGILADIVSSLPVAIVESIIFATICYWMVGFNTLFGRYIYFILVVTVVELTFQFATKATGYASPSFLIANIFVPPIVFGLNFFTGFVILQDRAPDYLAWFFWVSPFRYLFEGLLMNEFLGRDLECEDDEFLPPDDFPLFNDSFENGGFEGNQICPITSGELVLSQKDFHTDMEYKWYWLLVLIGYLLLAFIAVLFSASCIEHKTKSPRDIEKAEIKNQKQKERARKLTQSIHKNNCINSNPRSSSFDVSTDDNNDNSQFSFDSNADNHTNYRFIDSFSISKEGKRLETNIPIYLEWKNLNYFVDIKPKANSFKDKFLNVFCSKYTKQDLQLLHNISGYVKPGMLIAFMGPSGAGKTTLLDVLAQRKTAGRVEGEIFINGKPLDPFILSRFSGYVEQQNIHVETETVQEALSLSAALRLSFTSSKHRKISRKEKLEHVNWVISILGLHPVRNAMVKELSLEQKKRLTIGVELAANPSLLFLDEPTSGLDSIAASRIMKAIKAIADSGVAVVCTLHQPSEILFSWSTHLLLLATGGYVIYFGDLSNDYEDPLNYFSKLGCNYDPERNPADFFLDCCSSTKKNDDGKTIIESFQDSEQNDHINQVIDKGLIPRTDAINSSSLIQKLNNFVCCKKQTNISNDNDDDNAIIDPQTNQPVIYPQYYSTFARNPLIQWFYLTTRSCRYWWRSPTAMILTFIRSAIFGIILGLLFSEFEDTQVGAQERVGLIFFIVLVLSSSAMSFVPQIFEERAVFYREVASKTYREGSYLFSLVGSAIPIIFSSSIITLVLVWSLTNLQKGWSQIGYFFAVGCMLALIPYSFALFLCSLAPNPEAGNGMVSIINIVNAFTAGFLLIPSAIPPYWIWAYWIAYLHYALEGLLLNEFIGLYFKCPNNEGAIPIPVPSETNPLRVQFFCPIRDGKEFLEENFDANGSGMPIDISVLIGFLILLLCLAWLVLAKVKHIKR